MQRVHVYLIGRGRSVHEHAFGARLKLAAPCAVSPVAVACPRALRRHPFHSTLQKLSLRGVEELLLTLLCPAPDSFPSSRVSTCSLCCIDSISSDSVPSLSPSLASLPLRLHQSLLPSPALPSHPTIPAPIRHLRSRHIPPTYTNAGSRTNASRCSPGSTGGRTRSCGPTRSYCATNGASCILHHMRGKRNVLLRPSTTSVHSGTEVRVLLTTIIRLAGGDATDRNHRASSCRSSDYWAVLARRRGPSGRARAPAPRPAYAQAPDSCLRPRSIAAWICS